MADLQTKRPERFENLTAWLRWVWQAPVDRMAKAFIALGLSADTLTFLGLFIAVIAALLAAQGAYARAGLVVLLGGSLDAVDGAVARVSGRVRRFGALLDSTLDRYSEAVVLTGLGYHLARSQQWTEVLLVFASLLGSVMVSYVRARSESLGVVNKVGLLTRVERMAILILMLFGAWITLGLWILAVLTQLTVIQRMWHFYRVTRDERE